MNLKQHQENLFSSFKSPSAFLKALITTHNLQVNSPLKIFPKDIPYFKHFHVLFLQELFHIIDVQPLSESFLFLASIDDLLGAEHIDAGLNVICLDSYFKAVTYIVFRCEESVLPGNVFVKKTQKDSNGCNKKTELSYTKEMNYNVNLNKNCNTDGKSYRNVINDKQDYNNCLLDKDQSHTEIEIDYGDTKDLLCKETPSMDNDLKDIVDINDSVCYNYNENDLHVIDNEITKKYNEKNYCDSKNDLEQANIIKTGLKDNQIRDFTVDGNKKDLKNDKLQSNGILSKENIPCEIKNNDENQKLDLKSGLDLINNEDNSLPVKLEENKGQMIKYSVIKEDVNMKMNEQTIKSQQEIQNTAINLDERKCLNTKSFTGLEEKGQKSEMDMKGQSNKITKNYNFNIPKEIKQNKDSAICDNKKLYGQANSSTKNKKNTVISQNKHVMDKIPDIFRVIYFYKKEFTFYKIYTQILSSDLDRKIHNLSKLFAEMIVIKKELLEINLIIKKGKKSRFITNTILQERLSLPDIFVDETYHKDNEATIHEPYDFNRFLINFHGELKRFLYTLSKEDAYLCVMNYVSELVLRNLVKDENIIEDLKTFSIELLK